MLSALVRACGPTTTRHLAACVELRPPPTNRPPLTCGSFCVACWSIEQQSNQKKMLPSAADLSSANAKSAAATSRKLYSQACETKTVGGPTMAAVPLLSSRSSHIERVPAGGVSWTVAEACKAGERGRQSVGKIEHRNGPWFQKSRQSKAVHNANLPQLDPVPTNVQPAICLRALRHHLPQHAVHPPAHLLECDLVQPAAPAIRPLHGAEDHLLVLFLPSPGLLDVDAGEGVEQYAVLPATANQRRLKCGLQQKQTRRITAAHSTPLPATAPLVGRCFAESKETTKTEGE